jgi:Uma2 family endonuclease
MIATPNPQRISIEEYLDWEPLQELRYEYANGTIIAMAGGTVRHNDIAVNLLTLLHGVVRTQGCRININDVKLQVITKGAYRYPDLVVTCDSRDLQNGELLEYPTVIVEVLSPGTEAIDRGDKFNEYRTLESLQEYVLISASKPEVEVYRRGEGRMWLYYPYGGGDIIWFHSLSIEVPIEDIYANISFVEP